MNEDLHPVVRRLLLARGLEESEWPAFLQPAYEASKYDPFLLPDMSRVVERLLVAHRKQEKVVIYERIYNFFSLFFRT